MSPNIEVFLLSCFPGQYKAWPTHHITSVKQRQTLFPYHLTQTEHTSDTDRKNKARGCIRSPVPRLFSVIQTKSAAPHKGIDIIALLSSHTERLLSGRTTLLNAGGFIHKWQEIMWGLSRTIFPLLFYFCWQLHCFKCQKAWWDRIL